MTEGLNLRQSCKLNLPFRFIVVKIIFSLLSSHFSTTLMNVIRPYHAVIRIICCLILVYQKVDYCGEITVFLTFTRQPSDQSKMLALHVSAQIRFCTFPIYRFYSKFHIMFMLHVYELTLMGEKRDGGGVSAGCQVRHHCWRWCFFVSSFVSGNKTMLAKPMFLFQTPTNWVLCLNLITP